MDGTARTLIRWQGLDQLRLDPETKREISRATRPPTRSARRKGQPRRPRERRARFVGYRKQDDEKSLLVPGSAAARKVVVDVWRMYYCQNLGAHRIIQQLRNDGVPSPTGGDWNLTSVHNILWNYIYLGVEVRHRWTKALYHQLGPDGPIPVTVDQDQLQKDGKLSVPQTERPRDDWVLVDKPQLKDFLPPDVREAALPEILKRYDTDVIIAKQAQKAKRKNKHDDNPYVLAQVLHSKQTGRPMRGDTNTKKVEGGREVRRYYFDYSTASKAISGLCARRVRAEPLEDAVVPAVFGVLLDHVWVAERVRQYVAELSSGVRDVEAEKRVLIAEQTEITRRLKRVHKTSGHLSDDDLEALVADDNARLVVIRRQLNDLDRVDDRRPPTADEAVAAVTERLMTVPADWRSLPNAAVKDFLKSVVSDLKVDLETGAVTMDVCVPAVATAAIPASASREGRRVSFTSAWLSLPDAIMADSLKIEEIRCESDRKRKCYTCERLRRAA